MIRVDNTLLCDIEKCEAAGIARHVLGLRGTEEKMAADIGNVFHAGLEAHFRGQPKAQVLGVFEAEYNKLVPFGEQPEDPRFGRENVRKIMGRYCDIRPVERFPFTAIEFEQTVGVPLTADIIFYMKRDLLVRDKQSGLHAPCDHKTTRTISDWWAKKYRMLSQMSGYVWATQQMTGEPISECYVNALEVQKIPDSSRKCATHKVPYLECGVEHIKFELLTYSRTPEMLEAWRRDATIIAQKYAMLAQTFPSIEYLPFARRNGAFNDGCTFCEYKKWCATGFKAEMANGLVVYERWEPWAQPQQGVLN